MNYKKVQRAKKPTPLNINYEGRVSLDEFRQAIWQDLDQLEKDGVEFLEEAKLQIPIVNQYGDPMMIKDPDGRVITDIHSHAYRCAAQDYAL